MNFANYQENEKMEFEVQSNLFLNFNYFKIVHPQWTLRRGGPIGF